MNRLDAIAQTVRRANASGLSSKGYKVLTYLLPEPRAAKRRIVRFDTGAENLALANAVTIKKRDDTEAGWKRWFASHMKEEQQIRETERKLARENLDRQNAKRRQKLELEDRLRRVSAAQVERDKRREHRKKVAAAAADEARAVMPPAKGA